MKIEGIPDGWEFVGLRAPALGEFIVSVTGRAEEVTSQTNCVLPIIRKADPVCTWPHGVFADGWITQDGDDADKIEWHDKKPFITRSPEWWSSDGMGGEVCGLINPPVFRSDLPWAERIQQVGPSVEKQTR